MVKSAAPIPKPQEGLCLPQSSLTPSTAQAGLRGDTVVITQTQPWLNSFYCLMSLLPWHRDYLLDSRWGSGSVELIYESNWVRVRSDSSQLLKDKVPQLQASPFLLNFLFHVCIFSIILHKTRFGFFIFVWIPTSIPKQLYNLEVKTNNLVIEKHYLPCPDNMKYTVWDLWCPMYRIAYIS